MDETERDQLITAWIKYQYAEEESPQKEKLLWAEHKLWQLTEEDSELAWQLIIEVLKRDSGGKILQNLSAGPLEDLLSTHGKKFMERVEIEAEKNEKFRHLLGGVWKNEIPDDIWQRLQALVGKRW